jgi:hypothetical protein
VTNSFLIRTGDDAPVAAAAPHDGHALRADVRAASALGAEQRLREEDPFAAQWAEAVDTRLIGLRSRFEVDLNRPRERAVYQRGQGAWGLHVWRDTPPPSMVTASLAEYDSLYAAAGRTFARMLEQVGAVRCARCAQLRSSACWTDRATLEWVWWFNRHRLLGSIGHVPPVEYEGQFNSHYTPGRGEVVLT